jgi:hypothetical protein
VKRKHLSLIFSFFINLMVSAQTQIDDGQDVSQADRALWYFRFQPQMIGVDVQIGYNGLPIFPEVDTVCWLLLGIAYENVNFYRTVDGGLLTQDNSKNLKLYDDITFERLQFSWGLGISQEILKDKKQNDNILELFAYYRGHYGNTWSGNDDSLLRTQNDPLPDTDGIWQNSLLGGITFNTVKYNSENKIQSGLYAEASLEWAPEFFFNSIIGLSDFLRLNFTWKAFLPLLNFPEQNIPNLVSIYLANCLAVDYLTGSYIPINTLQSIGGIEPRMGMGGRGIRGLDKGRFDAELKLIDNLELRIIFPSLIHSSFAPGILLFIDSGYYYFQEFEEQGFVFSTGAGIFFIIVDKLQLTYYISYLLNEPRLDGSSFIPVGFSMRYHF